jgi:hypothetical protein
MQAVSTNTSNMNRLIGLGIALLGGLAAVPAISLAGAAAGNSGAAGFAVALVEALLVAGVSAWFLRTWWALLVIPAVYFVGSLVGGVVDAGVQGSLHSVGDALGYLALGAIAFLFTFLLPLLVGTAIGTPIGKRKR